MNNKDKEIPSAQDFASFQMFDFSDPDKYQEAIQSMIEFAQMHVERALKEASKVGLKSPYAGKYIINVYPKENIK